MDRFKCWLELLHEDAISENFDRSVPVVADEGMGKFTLILEGTDLWREFQALDQQKKEERMRPEEEEPEDDPRDIAAEIKAAGVDDIVSTHGGHNKPYIDPSLVEVDYDLGVRKAKKVKKLLDRTTTSHSWRMTMLRQPRNRQKHTWGMHEGILYCTVYTVAGRQSLPGQTAGIDANAGSRRTGRAV